MSARAVAVERFSGTSSKKFEDVMRAVDARIGQPKMSEFSPALVAAAFYEEMEALVRRAVGPTDLMEFEPRATGTRTKIPHIPLAQRASGPSPGPFMH